MRFFLPEGGRMKMGVFRCIFMVVAVLLFVFGEAVGTLIHINNKINKNLGDD